MSAVKKRSIIVDWDETRSLLQNIVITSCVVSPNMNIILSETKMLCVLMTMSVCVVLQGIFDTATRSRQSPKLSNSTCWGFKKYCQSTSFEILHNSPNQHSV